ncbi:restriction endonuclease subunit S (plasmid) [Bacillus haikouensis]|nr:restriction endonuclease subunit S [Bacillus haikouensis]
MVTEVKGVREGYKMTELGEIPEEWETTHLGDLLKVGYGKNQKNVLVESSEIPILGTGGIIGWSNKSLFNKPSVLIGRKGTIDRPIYIETPFWTIDTLFYTDIDTSKANVKFIYFLFQSINWYKYNEATGVPSLSASNISKIKVAIPNVKEQQKIAEILSTVDETIETTDQLLEKTKELKKGLMQQLLMKGIGHNEFKETELGEIPVGWDIRYMSEIGTFSKGKGIAKKDLTSTGHPCILYGELYTKYTERITNVISRTNFDSGKIEFGRVNDVLIPSSGETAIDIATSSALNVDNIAIGGDINIFRPKDNIYGSFISYSINSVRKGELSRLAQGSSVYHLYSSNLNKFKVLVPPLSEQKRIVEILSSVDDQIEGYEKEKKRLQELKKGLMQQLLTGKIRVTV